MDRDAPGHRTQAGNAEAPDVLESHPTGEDLKRLFAITGAPAAELEAIIHSMPDAIYIGGAQGIKKANRAALDMLGYDTVDELNRNIATLAEQIQTRHASTGARILPTDEPFARAMRGETVVETVIVRHLKTHKDVILRCAAAPIIFDGQVIGAVAINTDVTEREELNARLERSNADLRRANSSLTTLNHVVSHDLKEPVRAMQFYLEEAIEHALSPTTMENLLAAQAAHARLSTMLRRLLEFSRTASEPLVVESVDVREVLQSDICHSYYERLQAERGARVEEDIGAPFVLAAPFLLQQALGNLILNAIRHNDKPRPLVRVVTHAHAGRVLVRVDDNGPGFSQASRQRFDSGDAQTRHSLQGGFGLAIARHAVERLGGSMALAGSDLGGASIHITLPPAPSGKRPRA